jgi:hypothetical protein
MNSKGVYIDESLFDVSNSIPNASLTIQTYDLEKAKEVFMKSSVYRNSSISLTTSLNLGKELSFYTDFDRFDSPTMNDETTKKLAYELIEDLDLSLDDLYLKEIGRTGKKTILIFGQKIGEYVIDDSYMILKYNNDTLLEFQRVWYDVVSLTHVEKDFYLPEYALYNIMGQIYDRLPDRQRSITVNDLSLVYQLRPVGSENNLEELVIEGEARIYYQITTSDGEKYLSNALIE